MGIFELFANIQENMFYKSINVLQKVSHFSYFRKTQIIKLIRYD